MPTSLIDSLLAGDSELFMGIVAPMGTGTGLVSRGLANALSQTSCKCYEIHVIEQLRRLTSKGKHTYGPFDYSDLVERYQNYIDKGNLFCTHLKKGDALITLALKRVQELRYHKTGDQSKPVPRTVYVFRSLKREEEHTRLRRIYGPGFLTIAVHSPRQLREERLAKRIARSRQDFDPDRHREAANLLIETDEKQSAKYGQEVGSLFRKADVFLDGSSERTIENGLSRFVRLLYGHPFETPTMDEVGMAVASTVALRSADLAKQVGAAIFSNDGSLVAFGCNEVPKAGGGQYWPGAGPDHRDFRLGTDISGELRQTVLEDIVKRLAQSRLGKKELLSAEFKRQIKENPAKAVSEVLKDPTLNEARMLRALEYGRSVHAEMAAITDAARRGVGIGGCTLYTTTFPCHECCRHIISSGMRRVVFVEPYPKSLASILFSDSVDVDAGPEVEAPCATQASGRVRFEQYVGISPAIYNTLFTELGRKGKAHAVARWKGRQAKSRFVADPRSYLDEEAISIEWITSALANRDVMVNEIDDKKGSHDA